MISKIPLYFISFSKRSKVWISKMILSFAINHDFKLFSDILNGCYLNACTSHLYQTLVLPKLICTELICTTPWIYHGGPGTIEKRPNDFCRRQKSWVGAPAPGSPVRASFPECVRPYLEDGKNEVWYRWARYRWAWYRWVGKPEIGETKLCKLRGLALWRI